MQSLGCELGLHGYAHLSPNRLSATRFESDLKRCIAAFNQAGIRHRGYRAPNLAFHQSYYSILKKHGITYSSSLLCSEQRVDPMEKCIAFMDIPYILHNPGPEKIIGTLNNYFKPGNILCFHPYGLFATRYETVLRKLILDTGLQTITIAGNLQGGNGVCLSVDFGV
jgi:peptidoglycan/xylan/chitin deacetylase (PgdA/CDA1 family)